MELETLQKILNNIDLVFSEEMTEEKYDEIEKCYLEIKDEYEEFEEVEFAKENKDKIKETINFYLNQEDNAANNDIMDDDIGETNYYIDDSFKNIKYIKENVRIINIQRDFLDGTIVMPDFQRKYVWTKKQVAELIVSFMLGIPIPTIYGYSEFDDEDEKEKIYIIDGQQRLTSILFYYYSIFPKSLKNRKKYDHKLFELCENRKKLKDELKNSSNLLDKQVLKKEIDSIEEKIKQKYDIQLDVRFQTKVEDQGSVEIKDLSLDNLSLKSQNGILTTSLEMTMLKNFKKLENLSRIFNIYNSTGKPLTEDEIRKALYNKNYLYEKITEFCIKVDKDKSYSEFSKFNSTDILVSEKKIFQLLSYYFNLTFSFIDGEYKEDKEKLKKFIFKENFKTENLIKSTLDLKICNSSNRGKKIENIISEYSKYISLKTNHKQIEHEEFESIKKFFKLNFNRLGIKKPGKYSFKNLICIYILLRYFNKLENNIIITADLLSFNVEKQDTLEKERLIGIYNIFKEKGDI